MSTSLIDNGELSEATTRVRAALLGRASTADETVKLVKLLRWESEYNDKEEVEKQGLATESTGLFISDFFEELIELPGIKEKILKHIPDITPDDYEACMLAIWAILSSTQMYSELLEIEQDNNIDIEKWTDGYIKYVGLNKQSE